MFLIEIIWGWVKTGRHDIAQILLKLALKCQKSKIQSKSICA
jgi:hypothetical protein